MSSSLPVRPGKQGLAIDTFRFHSQERFSLLLPGTFYYFRADDTEDGGHRRGDHMPVFRALRVLILYSPCGVLQRAFWFATTGRAATIDRFGLE